jgi:cardiolipin synthase
MFNISELGKSIFSGKKRLSAALVTALLSLNACGNATALNVADINSQQVEAQSWFNNKGKVPDNGDINIKIDNEILARRTLNNAPAQYFIDGHTAYPAMEKLIDSAKKSLFVEIFIFRDDLTGRKIAEKLVAKKRQGIDVKIVIDTLGLMDQSADKRIYDYLVSQKMNVLKFNKGVISTTGINITHRKLLIVDGDRAMTGGMNFANEYENVWHDSMIQIEGEVVQDIQKEFFYDWSRSGGKIPQQLPSLEPGKVYGNIPMRIAVTSPHESKKKYDLKAAMLAAIDLAKTRIRMESPYFSDEDLILHLALARQRGVKIDVILPKAGDTKVFNYINMGNARTLLKNGINVYFYQGRFSHVKATIIDNMAIVGSANMDRRSFQENQELNVIIEDPALLEDMNTRLFDQDISQASIENLASTKVSLLKKIAITATEIIDYYL